MVAEKLILYRRAMQISRKFQDYNFREYFLRKYREDFRGPDWSIENCKKSLLKLQRQGYIQSLYPVEKSIIQSVSIPKLGHQTYQ
jgi:Complex 1 protein (LYR family)